MDQTQGTVDEYSELEELLRSRVTTWRAANTATNWPALEDLTPDEVIGAKRALTFGVVELTSAGRWLFPTLRSVGRRPTQPHALVLDGRGQLRVPWREFLTQVGAVAELILDYNWPPSQVALDPDSWEFDIGVYEYPHAESRLVICGEAKTTYTDLSLTVTQMVQRAQRRETPPASSKVDGDKKYRGLLEYEPDYFWAVAPGFRQAFRVRYWQGAIEMHEVPDLPRG